MFKQKDATVGQLANGSYLFFRAVSAGILYGNLFKQLKLP